MTVNKRKQSNSWTQVGNHARVFSGHESFSCRYGWLPKLYEAVSNDPELFVSDERSILTLGLGKNMVKALRFWGQSFGLIENHKQKVKNTKFAECLLGEKGGIDPYLENIGSLWRLHWNITARSGIGAWVTVFLDLKDHQIAKQRLIEKICISATTSRGSISESTAAAHVDMLLRTYDWSRFDALSSGEDISGCPFQELHLIETAKVNGTDSVILKRGYKTHLDAGAFAYALHDYWIETAPNSSRLSLRSLLVERRSPGVIFRLDEESLYNCLEKITEMSKMRLESDGIGGMDLVAPKLNSISELEKIAWQKH